MINNEDSDEKTMLLENRRKLGTYDGVLLNSVNTIFGAMVFLRWGFAVGQAGVLGASLILCLGGKYLKIYI
jgi:hypothetical protein